MTDHAPLFKRLLNSTHPRRQEETLARVTPEQTDGSGSPLFRALSEGSRDGECQAAFSNAMERSSVPTSLATLWRVYVDCFRFHAWKRNGVTPKRFNVANNRKSAQRIRQSCRIARTALIRRCRSRSILSRFSNRVMAMLTAE
jgi:hypothetical protein